MGPGCEKKIGRGKGFWQSTPERQHSGPADCDRDAPRTRHSRTERSAGYLAGAPSRTFTTAFFCPSPLAIDDVAGIPW